MTINRDKIQAIEIFALKNGWQRFWFSQQREAMEYLYKREFSDLETAIELTKHTLFNLDTKEFLDIEFLKSFFSIFPQIEILVRPDLNFVAKPIPARMIESYRYEDAWKHHAQVLVLKTPDERVDYLFTYIPGYLNDEIKKRNEIKRKKMNEYEKNS